MSARDDLINELRQWCSASEMEWVTASFDAYAAEVRAAALREAADLAGQYADADFTAGHVEISLRRMAEEEQ